MRNLRQDRIGADLGESLNDAEIDWLDRKPSVVQVVPLTSTIRGFASEVEVDPDPANGLKYNSAAQCQHIRGVSVTRVEHTRGNVGAAVLVQVREVLGVILVVPG